MVGSWVWFGWVLAHVADGGESGEEEAEGGCVVLLFLIAGRQASPVDERWLGGLVSGWLPTGKPSAAPEVDANGCCVR